MTLSDLEPGGAVAATMAARSVVQRLAANASIEVTLKGAEKVERFSDILPAGTQIFVTSLEEQDDRDVVRLCRRIAGDGCVPVPHIAARRLTGRSAAFSNLSRLIEEAGVRRILAIGGGLETPAGPFASTLALIDAGYFDRPELEAVAFAGHPEGHPQVNEADLMAVLEDKAAFAAAHHASVSLVTQFGFSAERLAAWEQSVRIGITAARLPIRLGLAGPARPTTLLKFAALCGVGESMRFLKANLAKIGALALTARPDALVADLARILAVRPDHQIEGLHLFPFGGVAKAAAWVDEARTHPENICP